MPYQERLHVHCKTTTMTSGDRDFKAKVLRKRYEYLYAKSVDKFLEVIKLTSPVGIGDTVNETSGMSTMIK